MKDKVRRWKSRLYLAIKGKYADIPVEILKQTKTVYQRMPDGSLRRINDNENPAAKE